MSVNNDAVGNRIKEIRNSNGWTLERMGKELNTSKVSVYNWENGRNLPNKERLKAIADLEGISVNELLYGNEKEYLFSILQIENDYDLFEQYYEYYVDYFGKNTFQDDETVLAFYDALEENSKDVPAMALGFSHLIKTYILANHSIKKNWNKHELPTEYFDLLIEIANNSKSAISFLNKYLSLSETTKKRVVRYAKEDIEKLNKEKGYEITYEEEIFRVLESDDLDEDNEEK